MILCSHPLNIIFLQKTYNKSRTHKTFTIVSYLLKSYYNVILYSSPTLANKMLWNRMDKLYNKTSKNNLLLLEVPESTQVLSSIEKIFLRTEWRKPYNESTSNIAWNYIFWFRKASMQYIDQVSWRSICTILLKDTATIIGKIRIKIILFH